jgi:hypothetical protein
MERGFDESLLTVRIKKKRAFRGKQNEDPLTTRSFGTARELASEEASERATTFRSFVTRGRCGVLHGVARSHVT